MKRALIAIFTWAALWAGAAAGTVSHVTADTATLARGLQLDNAVVYGSQNNFGVTSSQMSATTLSKQQIMAVPVFLGEPDVLKSLQKFPGVQSGTKGTAGVFVRGGDYDQNYITLDGSAIYNAEHMQGYVSAINPDVVHNINFYRGAFPARYGSRLSSVIDVGIKEGDYNSYHGLLSLGMLSSRVQAEGPIWRGHTSFNVAARMSYFNLIAKPILKQFYDRPSALQPYADMKYYDITAKVVHKFNARNRISALFYYGKDNDNESPTESYRSQSTIGDAMVIVDKQCRSEDYRASRNESSWSNLLSSIYFTTFLTPNHRLNVNLNYSQYLYDMSNKNVIKNEIVDLYRLYYSHHDVNSITSHSGIKDIALTADASLRLGQRHWLRYGLKLSRQMLSPDTKVFKDVNVKRFRGGMNYSGDESFYNPMYSTSRELVDYRSANKMHINNAALYAEDDYTILNPLKVNYGLRLSAYSVTGKTHIAAEPRLSVRCLIAHGLAVKASYSRMTQGIHRLVTNNLVMPSDIWVPITKDIPLMKSNLYGLGLNWDWKGFGIAVETYYKTLNNVLEYKNGASYFIVNRNWQEIVALGKGRSYGCELLVERKMGKTTGWLTYTWSKALRKFDRAGQEINGGREFYAATDHRHNFSVNVSHRFSLSTRMGLELSASWSYQSGRRGTVPIAITYGQSLHEYNYHIPIVINGETLFYYADLQTYKEYLVYYTGLENGRVALQFHTFRNINDFKLPDTHHLDVNASLWVKSRLGTTVLGLGIYNIYNHYNISNVYIGYKNNRAVLKGICPFPFMPSISVTQKF
jgi:outer membrane receptor for ferrienterochelin and colicin